MHNDIKIKDFPTNFQEIAEVIGIETALKLSEHFAGTSIYVPKLEDMNRKSRNDKIRRTFTGSNISELSQRFGLSDIQIRNILRTRVATTENYTERGQ